MRKVSYCFLTVTLALTTTVAFAQAGGKTTVCVGELQHPGNNTSATAVRDAMVKFIDKQKHASLEGVPLDTAVPTEAMTQAKSKNCQYAVFPVLTEDHNEATYGGGLSNISSQAFYVTVDYKVLKVSDGAELSNTTLKAQDHGSSQAAIISTSKKMADKLGDIVGK